MVSVTSNLPVGTRADRQDIEAWLSSLNRHYSKDENEQLRAACELSLSNLPADVTQALAANPGYRFVNGT